MPVHKTYGQVNAEQVMQIGRNVLGMDEYVLGIHYFNLAIKAKPYMAEPYYYRGLAKLMLDDFKGAREDCSMAIKLNKFLTEAYRVRGFALQRLGADSLALADYNVGLQYIPVDKYFLFYKATALASLKKYEQADSAFSLLTRYFPKFDAAYSERGRMNLVKGDTLKALNYIDTAIDLNKKEPFPFMLRADVNMRRKNWPAARADLDAAIELMPKEADLYLNRAYVRYSDDDYFGAMSDYNYILEIEPENMPARYNRGLLRYEIRDLNASAADFTEVLAKEPDNFHARYSRALINLEIGKSREAITDLTSIASKYPKFYPLYYAMAQAYQDLGDQRRMIDNYNKAENLVRQYVANPVKHPLDKPSINPSTSNDATQKGDKEETDMEVMEKFNQLVTVSSENGVSTAAGFKDAGIKGKVQERDMRIEPEQMYTLSIYDKASELRNSANYFKDLQNINSSGALPFKLYLTSNASAPSERDEIERLFDLANAISKDIDNAAAPIPAYYLARGIVMFLLRDYDGAAEAFNKSLEIKDDFTPAYIARGYLNFAKSQLTASEDSKKTAGSPAKADIRMAMEDFTKALELDPRLVYAWFNRGWLYYMAGDYTSALECYNKALEINSDFGEAYYNRALTYLRMGNKHAAHDDLSKAGELGVLPSYNLLKRMQ